MAGEGGQPRGPGDGIVRLPGCWWYGELAPSIMPEIVTSSPHNSSDVTASNRQAFTEL